MELNDKFLSLHTSLMTLTHNDSFVDKDRSARLKEILKQCAVQLDIARASIWILNDSSDNIQCELLYSLQGNHYETGLVLLEKDYPSYFKAITQNRIINANDALIDARTSEFADSYLKPLGILSMLDAPIFFRGKLYGILCLEQTHEYRAWDVSEMSYAASVADTISLINEHEHWLYSKEKMELINVSES